MGDRHRCRLGDNLAADTVLAAFQPIAIIAQSGIVKGNYWPVGHRELIANGLMQQIARRLARMRLRQKLQRHGVYLREVWWEHLDIAHLLYVQDDIG